MSMGTSIRRCPWRPRNCVQLPLVLLVCFAGLQLSRAQGSCPEFQAGGGVFTASLPLPASSPAVWSASHPVTVEFWAKFNVYPGSAGATLFEFYDTATSSTLFNIKVQGPAPSDGVHFYPTWQRPAGGSTASTMYPVGAFYNVLPPSIVVGWNHYAVVLSTDGASLAANIKVYFNGTLYSEITSSDSTYGPPAPSPGPTAPSFRFTLEPPGNQALISLREIRVWSYARSAGEIAADVLRMYRRQNYEWYPALRINVPVVVNGPCCTYPLYPWGVQNDVDGAYFTDPYASYGGAWFAADAALCAALVPILVETKVSVSGGSIFVGGGGSICVSGTGTCG